jgi:hypothetical protein
MGVIGMKHLMNLDVLKKVICMMETWVWQRITAATAEGEVILFHLPLLPNHQALQRNQLLRQRYVLTRPTGRIAGVLGVIGMKNMINLDVLNMVVCMKEAWVWQRITAATAEGGVILFRLPLLPNHQALQRSQLLLRAFPHQLHQCALTSRVGMIIVAMIVPGMKWMILDVLNMEIVSREFFYSTRVSKGSLLLLPKCC